MDNQPHSYPIAAPQYNYSLNCIVKTGISGQVVRITATAGWTLELAEVAVYGFGEFAAAY